MDNVALVELKPLGIQVIWPGMCVTGIGGKEGQPEQEEAQLPWSDHSGLVCGFGL